MRPKIYGRADSEKYERAVMNSKHLDKSPFLNSKWKAFCDDQDKDQKEPPNPQ